MCGIAGMLGRATREQVAAMLDPQQRRGPDGRDVWLSPDGRLAMGHDRLAIIDVAGGSQPMSNEDGTLWLAMNGEIYNHKELRKELEQRHTFRTRSDSEVVLHLYEEEGPEAIQKLDGMFAVAIWGSESGLFLARDPLGIKPLYFGYDAVGNFLFSSEIKGLVDHAVHIAEMPNGCWWVQNQEHFRYHTVPQPTVALTDPQQAIDTLDRTLTTAVQKRLMADVPLGVFLSGGLDSSLISSIVRQNVTGELHSFAVGLADSPDLLAARQVAAHLGTIHHERVLRPVEILSALPAVIDSLESCDPALVRSAIPTYFVSELASRYVKVVLSGEGADELFAGYHYLTRYSDPDALSDELRLITRNLHNSNLQRADRMTMAHGLEGRVPFLDVAMVDLAFRIDPALKRRDGEGKWVLRKVAERYLPLPIVWRKKEKFSIGTGIGPLLQRYAEEAVTTGLPDGWSKEEWLYWTHFRKRYGRDDLLAGMGRSRSLNPGQAWQSALATAQ